MCCWRRCSSDKSLSNCFGISSTYAHLRQITYMYREKSPHSPAKQRFFRCSKLNTLLVFGDFTLYAYQKGESERKLKNSKKGEKKAQPTLDKANCQWPCTCVIWFAEKNFMHELWNIITRHKKQWQPQIKIFPFWWCE